MKSYVFKSQNIDTKQNLKVETKDSYGLVAPFFDFEAALELFYANVYHRRCLSLKAALLSNVEDGSKLENQSVTPKELLYAFVLNLEIFGNAFLENVGERLYLLPSIEARVGEDGSVWQIKNNAKIALNATQCKYYSPRSRIYGEPDYLAAAGAINVSAKADRFNSAFFDNSARADKAIIFENAEPDEAQLDAFREFFGSNFKGYDNAHKTLIVTANGENAKIRIEDLSKTDDLSFEALKKLNRDEIIAAHGVPPRMVGVVESGSLGGSGELAGQLHSFNELTIVPKQEQIEWYFERIGYPIKLKRIDVSDFKDDSALVTQLVQTGILSFDEARAILGYDNNKKGSR